MRHFLRGAGLVFLPFVDLWFLVGWFSAVRELVLGEGDGGGIYVPGLVFVIAFSVGLVWINVRVGKRLVEKARRRSSLSEVR